MQLAEMLSKFPNYPTNTVDQELQKELNLSQDTVVVLDDDPTGTQTVHGLPVYTDWTPESIASGFSGGERAFFILTNSRAFSAATTQEVHRTIGENLCAQSRPFILVSRGDSTLRGHYPLETDTLRQAVETKTGQSIHGEILCPFFPEGGRYTIGNTHYVAYGDDLVPAGESEFAGDKTFGYKASDLTQWIEEKTGGEYRAKDVTCIALEQLRSMDYDGIAAKLCQVEGFGKVVVNALCYDDIKVFATAYLRAARMGHRFLFRCAAALVKVLSGVPDKPVLTREEMMTYANPNGGLIIVGSHVNKTTAQLEALRGRHNVAFIELNQHLVVEPEAFGREVERVIRCAEDTIAGGKTAAVYTRRERFDLNTGNKEDELRCATMISDRITTIVSRLKVRPSFLIAKGGITSSDIGTKGLGIKKALVLGQLLPGVPVWLTGPESCFPGLPYVIFPGNVGDEQALSQVVDKLSH